MNRNKKDKAQSVTKPIAKIIKSISVLGIITAFATVIGLVVDLNEIWDIVFGKITPTATQTLPIQPTSTYTITPIPTKTPIPPGPLLVEVNFDKFGDGFCDNSVERIYGYESNQYYIQPLSSAGYIIECNVGDWGPQGIIEVEAYPKGDLSFYGYGVIIGWQGNDSGSTDDACIFAVRRTSGVQPETKIYVKQRINGFSDTLSNEISDVPIDNYPHTVRLVMLDESFAVGYIDGQFVGEFNFRECAKGRIGLVAYGTGETKVYFDNLKFYSLP